VCDEVIKLKCGIDIIIIDRIEKMVERRGKDNLNRIWTNAEITDCTRSDGSIKFESLAARYAAKEAVSKAFGTGFGRHNVSYDEIVILKDKLGAPYITLSGLTKEYYTKQEFKNISVSLSHDGAYATAMCVIAEKNEVIN